MQTNKESRKVFAHSPARPHAVAPPLLQSCATFRPFATVQESLTVRLTAEIRMVGAERTH